MWHWKRILGWLVILTMGGWCSYDWVFISHGPAYFAADWRRVALVVAFSVTGALTVFGFMRFPLELRRRLARKIFATGLAFAVLGAGYSVWQILEMREFLVAAQLLWFVAAVELAMWLLVGGFCAWLWRYYSRKMRNIPSNEFAVACGPKALTDEYEN